MVRVGRASLAASLGLVMLGCSSDDGSFLTDEPVDSDTPIDEAGLTEADVARLRTFWPLPAVPVDPTNAVADDPWAQHFGQFLFFETSFSSTGDISCASCHTPELGWTDGAVFSDTISPTARHAPTILNTAYNRWQFWDGRCDTPWCQAAKPFEAASEMGGNRVSIVRSVHDDARMHEAYVDLFGPLPQMDDPRFPEAARPLAGARVDAMDAAWEDMLPEDRDAVNRAFTNLTKSIAAFERRLVSRDSDFDRWARAMLLDDSDADRELLSTEARRGYKHFIGDGLCMGCHTGPTFSNQEFHNVGLGARPWLDDADNGRAGGILGVRADPFNGRGNYSDDPEFGAIKLDYLVITQEQDGQFKTPGLRDLARTGPYMHGGHLDTLEDVVRNYIVQEEVPPTGHAEELLALITMEEGDIPDVVAFLETLQGAPLDDELTRQPADPRYSPPE